MLERFGSQSKKDIEAQKKAGLAVPMPAEALKNESDMRYLEAEVKRMVSERPEDTGKFLEALDAAEKALELESENPNFGEVVKSSLAHGFSMALVAIILSPLFPMNAGVVSAAATSTFTVDMIQRRRFKQEARKRLQRIRSIITGKSSA